MHKKFDINQTKIKGSCQSGRKVVTHNSMSDLPLAFEEWLRKSAITATNRILDWKQSSSLYKGQTFQGKKDS